jgi:hypothetical protein
VSDNSVQADWHELFSDGEYHHFDWAVGTGEGKGDILDYQDVGMNRKVLHTGLDLTSVSTCYISLRACKSDGRITDLCVKAHALKGQLCVHRRLIVGDGFVSITKGESMRQFFEHAEEAEEEDVSRNLFCNPKMIFAESRVFLISLGSSPSFSSFLYLILLYMNFFYQSME